MRSLWREIRGVETGDRAVRLFGLLIGGVLIVLGMVFREHHALGLALVVGGGTLMVLGPAAPRILRLPYKAWMALALVLGYVMTRVLLTAVFVLIVTPLGIAMRLSGRDPMQRKRDPDRASYWSPRQSEGDARKQLERPY